jgi:hypothetical protein
MNTLKLFVAAGAIALACGAGGAASAATIADYSFETPAGVGGFLYRPNDAPGVVFNGDAGVASGTGYAQAPDGVQNAFLQSTSQLGARIDITVTGLTVGDVYSFSFFDAQRNGFAVDAYAVLFDNQQIAAFSPGSIAWTARTTGVFTAAGATGTLTFAAPVLAGDNNTGIDDITLNAVGAAAPGGVPEPSAWALMLVGFGGLGAALRRRRQTLAAAI